MFGHGKDTLRLGTAGKGAAGILCGRALQGHLVVGHCKTLKPTNPTARVGNYLLRASPPESNFLHKKRTVSLPTILAALQMHCKNIAVWHYRGKCRGVRHCKGWARQGQFAATERCRDTVHGHGRDTVALGAAGMLWRWALQEYSAVAVGHGRDTLRLGTAGSDSVWEFLPVALCMQWAEMGSLKQLERGHLSSGLLGFAGHEETQAAKPDIAVPRYPSI